MTLWVENPDDAVKTIETGQSVVIGGFLSTRHPMALIRALLRKGVRDLTIVAPGGGIDLDLLIAFGAVRRVILGVGSLDLVGPAPHFRRAAEAGEIEVIDFGGTAIARALEAAARGLRQAPARALLGSDLRATHPGTPDNAEPAVLHLPAMEVDIALIHAERADCDGNLRLFAPYLDTIMAAGAKRVIASVEHVVSRESLSGWGSAGIPRAQVDVIVQAQLGAHPTGCYPDYAPDYEHLLDYVEAAGAGPEALRAGFVAPDEHAYRAGLPVTRVLELRALATSGGRLQCR